LGKLQQLLVKAHSTKTSNAPYYAERPPIDVLIDALKNSFIHSGDYNDVENSHTDDAVHTAAAGGGGADADVVSGVNMLRSRNSQSSTSHRELLRNAEGTKMEGAEERYV
jgi:hypothetical protein